MDIDQIKEQWKRIDTRTDLVDQLNHDILSCKRYKRRLSLTDKLRRRYLFSLIVCCVAPLLMLPLSHFIDIPLPLFIAYPAFFVVMGVLNLILYLKLGRISVTDLSVKDALVKATRFSVLRRRIECLGVLMALPLVVYLMWIFRLAGNEGLYYGGWIGAALGVAVGLAIEIRTSRDIRRLKDELRKDLDGADE